MAMDVSAPTTSSTAIIDYMNGQYSVDGEPKTEEQVNAELAAAGTPTRVQGGYVIADGMDPLDLSGPAAYQFGDSATPVIPAVSGQSAPISSLGNGKTWLPSGDSSDGSLMWRAMLTFATQQMQEKDIAHQQMQANHQGKLSHQQAEIKATESKIEAERELATQKMILSISLAVVSAALQIVGAGAATSGAGLGTQAANFGGSVLGTAQGAIVEGIMINSDAQARKWEGELQEKYQKMAAEEAGHMEDEGKKMRDDAEEMRKSIIKMLQDIMQTQTDNVRVIAQTT